MGWVPASWRIARIQPLLKPGTPSDELGSLRPIGLTSCVAKLMERLEQRRLVWLAETNGWFSRLQAGFRKKRSTVDQLARMVQGIPYGYPLPTAKKGILLLFDYKAAYDKVWRQRLLQVMLDIGVPTCFVRWISKFLSDRRAFTTVGNTRSRIRVMREGLPQGSVLAPILFLFHINDLASTLT